MTKDLEKTASRSPDSRCRRWRKARDHDHRPA